MVEKFPRLLIAGLSGDSGKTIVSLSLLTALSQKGLAVSVFKKGPDYIDSAWLSAVSKSDCRNLDTYLVEPEDVYGSFIQSANNSEISVIEGNRGIFDGKDITGTHSSAGLAKLLQAPVILVVDCTKATRTIAALIKGCIEFDSEINIAGVILNRIAGNRHKKVVAESIQKYCKVPVLGVIPKLANDKSIIPGRHLGLITPSEFKFGSELENKLKEISEKYLDIDNLIKIANNAEPLKTIKIKTINNKKDIKIGYFRDSVFTFYYPENLEALETEGAELIKISSFEDKSLPEIDALYIGGGFPETQAQQLAGNQSMMESVRKAAIDCMPIYAECGGLIYLSRSLYYNDKAYPMAGVFPIDLMMNNKPVGHGYTSVTIDSPNPYFEIGTHIKGHEFHYTGLADKQLDNSAENLDSCMKLDTGFGLGRKRDGLTFKNALACYTHIHASGVKNWARSMIKNALRYKTNQMNNIYLENRPIVNNSTGFDDFKNSNLCSLTENINST